MPDVQARKDASGFAISSGNKFAYFFYYTDYFPLATLNDSLTYSAEGAEEEIKKNGKDLIMEYNHWVRLGENARVFAFLPNAYLNGSPVSPSLKLFNALVFVLSLIVLYTGFWRIKHAAQGFILVVMINFTPFFLYEVYSNENIFALMGSVFFMVLGLNVFVLLSKEVNYYKAIMLSVLSAVIVGFFSEIRNEVSVVLLSLLLIYFFSGRIKIKQKLVLITVVILSFFGCRQLIRNYFNYKFEEAAELVKENGGHVYTGKKLEAHLIWHQVFCGVGDFDTKYGYEWSDSVAYKYALPILRKKYGMEINYSGKYYTDDYYDKDRIYYIKFEELDAYEAICREKVISDILNDPWWYIKIIISRIIRTLTITIPVPYIGWLLLPLLFYLIKNHDWDSIKLILVSLPLSATSLIIYSGRGSTYNSVFVYLVIVIIISILLKHRAVTSSVVEKQ